MHTKTGTDVKKFAGVNMSGLPGDPICLVFRSFDPIFGMACFGDLGLFTAVQLGRANYVLTAPP